jgi:alcohol dehydrogenase class IV
VLLPNVLRFNLPAAPERYAEISVALGVERNGSAEATANKGLEVLSQLSRSCGVPQRISEFGVPRDAIPWMAKTAMQVQRLLKNNPRPVTEADAVGIYEATF